MNTRAPVEPLIAFNQPPWDDIASEGWLTEYPLPIEFTWPDRYGHERRVLPTYKLKGGYGKWLAETPYFPGLFELCHRILARAPANQVLTPEWLVAELNKYRPTGEQQNLL